MAFNENKTGLSRRKFLSGTGALALAPMALNRFELPSVMAAAAKPSTIIRRKLGKTDIEVPIISMGVMNADNPAVIQESFNTGIRLFDTARTYQRGGNELILGRVLGNLNARNQAIIQTKDHALLINRSTAAERTKALLASLGESLAALNTDYVDIYLLHGPSTIQMNDSGVREALAEMKKQKKARYIGFATHSNQAEQLNIAAKDGFYDTISLSLNFTMAQDTALLNAVRNAANEGIGLIAMKTQAGGGRPKPGVELVPASQTAALKWVLRHEEITTAIPGYTNFDHMRENFSVASGLEYTNAEREFLSGRNVQALVQFCLQCGECRPGCPNDVDIPTLMRTHMYAAGYGNFVHARAALDEIASNVSLKNCADCSACGAKCSNYVSIADNIRDLKAMYLGTA